MPLRVWRTDEMTPAAAHPDDPARQKERPRSSTPEGGGLEFLTLLTVAVPADAVRGTVEAVSERESDRNEELAQQGHLERLWALLTQDHTLGLWRAPDIGSMDAILGSLPL